MKLLVHTHMTMMELTVAKKKDTNVRMHTKSKRMELENPGCSGLKDF